MQCAALEPSGRRVPTVFRSERRRLCGQRLTPHLNGAALRMDRPHTAQSCHRNELIKNLVLAPTDFGCDVGGSRLELRRAVIRAHFAHKRVRS
jgi:hypothetical protein